MPKLPNKGILAGDSRLLAIYDLIRKQLRARPRHAGVGSIFDVLEEPIPDILGFPEVNPLVLIEKRIHAR
jgi:hypothetical protein